MRKHCFYVMQEVMKERKKSESFMAEVTKLKHHDRIFGWGLTVPRLGDPGSFPYSAPSPSPDI
jgi:hypothetical protein